MICARFFFCLFFVALCLPLLAAELPASASAASVTDQAPESPKRHLLGQATYDGAPVLNAKVALQDSAGKILSQANTFGEGHFNFTLDKDFPEIFRVVVSGGSVKGGTQEETLLADVAEFATFRFVRVDGISTLVSHNLDLNPGKSVRAGKAEIDRYFRLQDIHVRKVFDPSAFHREVRKHKGLKTFAEKILSEVSQGKTAGDRFIPPDELGVDFAALGSVLKGPNAVVGGISAVFTCLSFFGVNMDPSGNEINAKLDGVNRKLGNIEDGIDILKAGMSRVEGKLSVLSTSLGQLALAITEHNDGNTTYRWNTDIESILKVNWSAYCDALINLRGALNNIRSNTASAAEKAQQAKAAEDDFKDVLTGKATHQNKVNLADVKTALDRLNHWLAPGGSSVMQQWAARARGHMAVAGSNGVITVSPQFNPATTWNYQFSVQPSPKPEGLYLLTCNFQKYLGWLLRALIMAKELNNASDAEMPTLFRDFMQPGILAMKNARNEYLAGVESLIALGGYRKDERIEYMNPPLGQFTNWAVVPRIQVTAAEKGEYADQREQLLKETYQTADLLTNWEVSQVQRPNNKKMFEINFVPSITFRQYHFPSNANGQRHGKTSITWRISQSYDPSQLYDVFTNNVNLYTPQWNPVHSSRDCARPDIGATTIWPIDPNFGKGAITQIFTSHYVNLVRFEFPPLQIVTVPDPTRGDQFQFAGNPTFIANGYHVMKYYSHLATPTFVAITSDSSSLKFPIFNPVTAKRNDYVYPLALTADQLAKFQSHTDPTYRGFLRTASQTDVTKSPYFAEKSVPAEDSWYYNKLGPNLARDADIAKLSADFGDTERRVIESIESDVNCFYDMSSSSKYGNSSPRPPDRFVVAAYGEHSIWNNLKVNMNSWANAALFASSYHQNAWWCHSPGTSIWIWPWQKSTDSEYVIEERLGWREGNKMRTVAYTTSDQLLLTPFPSCLQAKIRRVYKEFYIHQQMRGGVQYAKCRINADNVGGLYVNSLVDHVNPTGIGMTDNEEFDINSRLRAGLNRFSATAFEEDGYWDFAKYGYEGPWKDNGTGVIFGVAFFYNVPSWVIHDF